VRRGQPGRPLIPREVRDLIRKMCRENSGWGAPRIHGELLKLGIDIGQSSVGKYMVRSRKPPSQTWRTFLENHAKQLVSIDLFTVPTIRFQLLYVFLVLVAAFCTSMGPPTRPRSGLDSNSARHFPLTNSRATCCGTAMRPLAITSENR